MQSPPKPWKPGIHPTYTSLQMVVNICQDEFGNVWSDHDFLTPMDEETGHGLAQGGVLQVAHALLTEAVRREVFTCALLQLSRDPTFLAQWIASEPSERQKLEEVLQEAALAVITATTGKMLPGAVAGVLAMLIQQGGASPGLAE